MRTLWIDITDIPASGREFSFTDTAIWADPAKGFGMEMAFEKPVEATLFIIPQEDSCLVRGSLTGGVSMPCGRCTQPASIDIDVEFESFEELTSDDETAPPLLREHQGKLELDAGTILWEQFVLALPDRPLCSEECKGLCSQCGADLNTEQCDCSDQGGDPRLAVLRGLKIDKK